MYLTEAEENEIKTELLFTILDDFVTENYDVSPDYVMTEEDAYVLSIVMDYFMENYHETSLAESAYEALAGTDYNARLFEDLNEILMDESVGSFVAGAVHGIRNFLSKKKADRATSSKTKAKAGYEKYKTSPTSRTMKHDTMQKAHDKTDYGSSIKGSAKSAFHQAKINAIKSKADKAKETMKSAETKRKSAVAKHQSNVDRSNQLAKKIDTGITNIKNKVRAKVTAGAQKVAGALGTAAGHLAS